MTWEAMIQTEEEVAMTSTVSTDSVREEECKASISATSLAEWEEEAVVEATLSSACLEVECQAGKEEAPSSLSDKANYLS